MTNASDIPFIDRSCVRYIGEIASMSFGISVLFDAINWPIHLVELFKVCQLNDVIRFINILGAHKHAQVSQHSAIFNTCIYQQYIFPRKTSGVEICLYITMFSVFAQHFQYLIYCFLSRLCLTYLLRVFE